MIKTIVSPCACEFKESALLLRDSSLDCYDIIFLQYTAHEVFKNQVLNPDLILSPKLAPIINPLVQLGKRLLQIIIHHNLIMSTRLLGIRQFVLGLRKTFLERFFGLGAAAAETALELFDGGRGKEEEARVEVRFLDLFDALEKK